MRIPSRYQGILRPVVLAAGLSFIACSNDSKDIARVIVDPDAPDEIIQGLSMIYSDSGQAQVTLRSGELRKFYDEQRSDLFDGIEAKFYKADGTVESILRATEGFIDETKGLVMVKKNVVFENLENGERLETQILYWNREKRIVYNEAPVTIYTKDGVAYGQGLKADERFSWHRIIKPVSEFLLTEEENDSNSNAKDS